MPERPRKPCPTQGCTNLVKIGIGLCDDCEHERMKDRGMTSGSDEERAFYKTARWLRTQKRIIKRDPICKLCNRSPSTICDHILAMRLGGKKFDQRNLQGVCDDCHHIKRGQEAQEFARRRKQGLLAG